MLSMLIVDDDQNLARTLALGVRKQMGGTVQVDHCFNSSEALELFVRKNYDLVVSDYRMPGKNGIELFKELRPLNTHSVLVLITAFGSADLQKEAERFADAYISKPFDIPVLTTFITHLFGEVATEPTTRRILVLEDDPYLRRLIIKVAGTGILEAFEAATLAEARTHLDSGRFDVMIVDVQVPDGFGTDLIKEYREVLSQNGTAVILLTGEARFRYLEEELGIDMFLEKPVSIQDLVTLIQRWTTSKLENMK